MNGFLLTGGMNKDQEEEENIKHLIELKKKVDEEDKTKKTSRIKLVPVKITKKKQ